ncbi:MAG: hypothetical protein A2805_03415 [Candidatus Andersenbacteria bacterium RIFCSPHIGHO2_01_FULL_46_36]|uniref:Calx-beta domain-containing protein n=1 Tax=Candidatus Andersenbacteria bacterium RIFCSPHIGHO2_12_FULL_45_11 TaxID=1797281 RepID=A0A1G1X3R9_9BACT|nr:MAG: hypothetical protein A2805_03415 [Candidatus Andersenbacteria bacterium RIFCSPHIGHO2_01_FULL_46_36]OGY34220.1 MAG: hypothetical protein A3D99_03725 [Candidatus Andersenbacteria bacterium RIFCSPHIGHO2_12_FULL_45_11]
MHAQQQSRTTLYLDVKDSNNTNATSASCATGCTNSLNNTNWGFPLTLSGTVYSDEGVTALTSKTVRVAINGTDDTSTTSHASTGAYSLSVPASSGDVLTLYIEDETQDGVTVTITAGSAMSNMDIYQDHLIVRHDNSGSLTNTNLNTAAVSAETDISNIYAVASSNLTVASGKELFIPTSHTFAPGGDVTTPTFDLRGTYTHSTETVTISTAYQQSAGTFSSSSGTVDINGNFTLTGGTHNATSGTFTVSGDWSNTGTFTNNSGTVTFDGTSDQTITTAGQAFNALTFNNTGSSGSDDLIISGTLDVDGTLTITDGDLDVSTNDPNVNLAADATIGASGTIDNASYSGTWTFDGTGTDTLTDNTTSGTNFRAVTVDGTSSKILQFSSGANTPTITFTTLTIAADDTVSLNGENTTITTLVNNNALTLIGSETVAITTMDADSGTVTYVGTGTYTQLAAGDAYYHLTLNGSGGSWTQDAALDVNGNLTIIAGTLATGNNAITLAGNWTNDGIFTAGTGIVTLDGAGSQTINDSNAFYSLSISATSARTISFESAATQTIAANGTLTLTGQSGNLLTLAPLTAVTAWNLVVPSSATQALSYVSVSYSDASGGVGIDCQSNCTNGGNTTNWQFTTPSVTFSADAQTAAEAVGSITITATLSASSLLATSLPYTLSGLATEGSDYTITTSPITIAAGTTTGTITITLTDDTSVESDETIIVTMGTPTNAAQGVTTVHTATITSEDVAVIVTESNTGSSGSSGGGGGEDPLNKEETSNPTVVISGKIAKSGSHIKASVGETVRIRTKPVDPSRLQSVMIKVMGKTTNLKFETGSENNITYGTTLFFERKGTYPYTIYANYGSIVRYVKGVFVVTEEKIAETQEIETSISSPVRTSGRLLPQRLVLEEQEMIVPAEGETIDNVLEQEFPQSLQDELNVPNAHTEQKSQGISRAFFAVSFWLRSGVSDTLSYLSLKASTLLSHSPALPDHLKNHRYETVAIRVASVNDKPLVGVSVTLFSEPKTATTDDRGVAIFHDVHAGQHTLKVAVNDFTSRQKLFLDKDADEVVVSVQAQLRDGVSIYWVLIYVVAALIGGAVGMRILILRRSVI